MRAAFPRRIAAILVAADSVSSILVTMPLLHLLPGAPGAAVADHE